MLLHGERFIKGVRHGASGLVIISPSSETSLELSCGAPRSYLTTSSGMDWSAESGRRESNSERSRAASLIGQGA